MDEKYVVPEGTLPLLGGILSMMHFAHRDMCEIVAGLSAEALIWKPGPEMGSLAGIIAHTMYCEAFGYRRAAGEDVVWDAVGNEALWDCADDTTQAIARITDGDSVMKRILPTMTVAKMGERYAAWDPNSSSSGGDLIAEAATHSAMHWGHLQITRQLWEEAHPEFDGVYTRW